MIENTISDGKNNLNQTAQTIFNKNWDYLKKSEKVKVRKSLSNTSWIEFNPETFESDIGAKSSLALDIDIESIKTRLALITNKMGDAFTNGHILIIDKKVAQKLRDVIWNRRDIKKIATCSRTDDLTIPDIKQVIPNTKTIESGIKLQKQIIIFTHNPDLRSKLQSRLLMSTGKNQIIVNAIYIYHVEKDLPNGNWFTTQRNNINQCDFLWYIINNKIKAVLMPIRKGDYILPVAPNFIPTHQKINSFIE